MSSNPCPALTPLRLTLAIALLAIASSGYVVFAARDGAPSALATARAHAPQPLPFGLAHAGGRGSVSFATPSP